MELNQSNSRLSILFAVLLGVSIPALAFGRVVFAATLGLAVFALLASQIRQPAWRFFLGQLGTPVAICISVTLALWLVSAMGSSFVARSAEASLRSVLFIVFGVLVTGALRAVPPLAKVSLSALTIAAAISVGFAVVASTALPELYWLLRLHGPKSTPLKTEFKSFSALAVMLVPLLLWYAWRWRGILALVAMAGAATMLYMVSKTHNRAALAGFVGAALAFGVALLARRATKRNFILFAAGFASVVAGVIIWLKTSRYHMVAQAPAGDWAFPIWLVDFQRQTIWTYVLKIFESAPWFGIGANSINFAPGADLPMPGNEKLHIIPAHPHNWLMEILAETGAIGLTAMLVAVAAATLAIMQKYRRTGAAGYLVAAVIFGGYWVSGLFNFSYWSAWWQVAFVLAVAMAVADPRPSPVGTRSAA